MTSETISHLPLAKRIQRYILASRFLTTSLVIHLIIVLLLGTTVLFNVVDYAPDFESEGGDFVEPGMPMPQNETLRVPNQTVKSQVAPTTTTKQTITSIITTAAVPTTNFTVAMSSIVSPTVKVDVKTTSGGVAKTTGVGAGGLPGTMLGRLNPVATGKKGGMKDSANEAVLKSLRWLKSQQRPDGLWGENHQTAVTGLALLSFLGHNETTTNSVEFSDTVKNGVDALLLIGTKNEGKLCKWDTNATPYEHAIGCYALSEAFTMTRDDRIPPVLTKAIGYILNGQKPDGGWRYPGYDKGGSPSDSSVSGWQVQALKAAKLTGLKFSPPLPPIEEVMKNAMRKFESVFDEKSGCFGYTGKDRQIPNLTGVGVLCLALGREGVRDSLISRGLKAIIDNVKVKYDSRDANLYAWYYDTQACFMTKDRWPAWNRMFQDELINNQAADGFWPATGGHEEGMAGENPDTKVYRTTLCCLMLEAYYRFLPTTQ